LDISKVYTFTKLRTLLSIDGLGIMKILKLVDFFGSIDNLFASENDHLLNSNKITPHLIQKLLLAQQRYKSNNSVYENEIEQVEKIGAKIITYWDNQYPQQLKNIYYPPLILYVIGELTENDFQSISIPLISSNFHEVKQGNP